MRIVSTSIALLVTVGVASAQARVDFAHSKPTKTAGTNVVQHASGSFSGGGGTCASPTLIPAGPAVNIPFDNTVPASGGTATNPFELICLHTGQLGIDNEEWFSWAATADGVAQLSTCANLIGVDTKIAIYADDCPNIATLNPLACKDDTFFCPALETTVTWDITMGTNYLIQLGTFATAMGGAADFSIAQLPARAPGQIDLGATSNATGTAGTLTLDYLAGHTYDAGAGELLNSVDFAWGSPGAPALPAGLVSRLVVYSGDAPNLVYLADQVVVHSMANTDTFVNYPLTTPVSVSGLYSVAMLVEINGPLNGAHFPIGWDDSVNSLDGATGLRRAWDAIEATTFPLDFMNPSTAQLAPLDTQLGGADKVFMLRVNTTPDVSSFASLCNGDGGDQLGCTDCPCGNNSPMGTVGGCLNSASTSTQLIASGNPSVSLPSGDTTDLRFGASGAPGGAFCILNSGDAVAPQGMANPCFGLNSGAQSVTFDGLRCAVQNTRRHGGRSADLNGDVGVTNNPWGGEGGPPVGIAIAGGAFSSGQTRYFQIIHRDDPLAVCTRGLNTSQASEVTFTP